MCGDLKFDAQGNIIDDGLNLNLYLPKDSKKAEPLVQAKSNTLLPQLERVISNSAAKGIRNRNDWIFYINLAIISFVYLCLYCHYIRLRLLDKGLTMVEKRSIKGTRKWLMENHVGLVYPFHVHASMIGLVNHSIGMKYAQLLSWSK